MSSDLSELELNKALELYRNGQVDQAADLLKIENSSSTLNANKPHSSNANKPHSSNANKPHSLNTSKPNSSNTSSKSNRKSAPNTMVLDTVSPRPPKPVALTSDLMPFQPQMPNFFPVQGQNLAQISVAHKPQIDTRPKTPKNSKIPIKVEEKVLGQDLPREIETSMMKWLQIDGDLNKLRQIKRDLDNQKKELEEDIKGFMEQWEIPEIGPNQDIGLEFRVKEVKQGFSKKLVTETLGKIFSNTECDKILNIMESQRIVTEKTCLKLNKPKPKK